MRRSSRPAASIRVFPIPREATAIHGITDEDVKDLSALSADRPVACPVHRGVRLRGIQLQPVRPADAGRGVHARRGGCRFPTPQIHRRAEHLPQDGAADACGRLQFYCDKDLTDAHSAEADTLATYEVLKAQLDRYAGTLENDVAALSRLLHPGTVRRLCRTHPLQRERGGDLRIREVQGTFRSRNFPSGTELLHLDDERRFPALYQKGDHGDPPAGEKRETLELHMLKKMCFAAALLLGRGESAGCGTGPDREITVGRIHQRSQILCTYGQGGRDASTRWPRPTGVSEQVISSENPLLSAGLRSGQTIKIPMVESVVTNQTPKSTSRKLKRTFDQHTVQAGGDALFHFAAILHLGRDHRRGQTPDSIGASADRIDPADPQEGRSARPTTGRMPRAWVPITATSSTGWPMTDTSTTLLSRGETMFALSRRFDTTVDKLISLNGIQPSELRSGSMIKIPAEARVVATIDPQAGSGRSAAVRRTDSCSGRPHRSILWCSVPAKPCGSPCCCR